MPSVHVQGRARIVGQAQPQLGRQRTILFRRYTRGDTCCKSPEVALVDGGAALDVEAAAAAGS